MRLTARHVAACLTRHRPFLWGGHLVKWLRFARLWTVEEIGEIPGQRFRTKRRAIAHLIRATK